MFAPWIPLAHGRAIHSEVVAAALLRIAAQTQLRRPFLALHTRPARQCHTRFGVPPAHSASRAARRPYSPIPFSAARRAGCPLYLVPAAREGPLISR